MTLSTEQLAELLAGIARSQQAIIDAIESESGGWRNTHLLPKLNTAANTRLATPRLLDIPSRILLRSQGRQPMDIATIVRSLEAVGGGAEVVPTTQTPNPLPAASQGAPIASTATIAAGAAVATAAVGAVAVATAGLAPASGADDQLGNFFDN